MPVRSVTEEGGKKIEEAPRPPESPFLPLEPKGFCCKKREEKKEIKNMKRVVTLSLKEAVFISASAELTHS